MHTCEGHAAPNLRTLQGLPGGRYHLSPSPTDEQLCPPGHQEEDLGSIADPEDILILTKPFMKLAAFPKGCRVDGPIRRPGPVPLCTMQSSCVVGLPDSSFKSERCEQGPSPNKNVRVHTLGDGHDVSR